MPPENRLARETSPYLLQHRHNPVDWFPWSDEAFAEAERRDVPVFLSIGYSTCYWCHVMERESFENAATAALLNDNFVSIKVDREERPDVDDVYMAAVQVFSGRGGWPMTLFLEPRTRKPFFAGTYFPPDPSRLGAAIPAFPQVLANIAAAWRNQRAEIAAQAEQLAAAVHEHVSRRAAPVRLEAHHVETGVAVLLRMHDRVHGGFGGSPRGPKFPQPVFIDLLLELRRYVVGDTLAAIEAAVSRTLDAMALGGLFDHLGGGFHRYSVDEKWLVPHFEKMLYDNALLAETYALASEAMPGPFWVRTARSTLDYVLTHLTGPEGVFYSAQDAEVDHREGLNYLWTPDEVRAAMGDREDDARLALDLFGLSRGPNFQDPHHPGEPARSVLHLSRPLDAEAAARGIALPEFLDRFDRLRAAMLAARSQRKQPSTDDKAITAWNGLMIGALASASRALSEPRFFIAAERAARFILRAVRERPAPAHATGFGSGGLRRIFRAGESRIDGFLEDYAFLIHGLTRLHRAAAPPGSNSPWLTAAIELLQIAEERFGEKPTDSPLGASYFDTPDPAPDLFVRTRSAYDGALPAASSVMVHNLLDLAELTGDHSHARRAASVLKSLSGFIAETPAGAANSLRALLRMLVRHPAILDEAFESSAQSAPAPSAAVSHETVRVLADRDWIVVGAESPAMLRLRFEIAEGHHINAADPVPGADPRSVHLVPLRIGIAGGTGVNVFADYPPGESYGEQGEIRVHRGVIEVPVVVERSGNWSGAPVLTVRFQACTDAECLAPSMLELDVRIDRE